MARIVLRLIMLLVSLPAAAMPRAPASPYHDYEVTYQQARETYLHYRNLEQAFDGQHLRALNERLEKAYASLTFDNWRSGFLLTYPIHPYVLLAIDTQVLVHSLFLMLRQTHDAFKDLMALLLSDLAAAEEFFDPHRWTNPAFEQALRAREARLRAAEARQALVRKLILYENRQYPPYREHGLHAEKYEGNPDAL